MHHRKILHRYLVEIGIAHALFFLTLYFSFWIPEGAALLAESLSLKLFKNCPHFAIGAHLQVDDDGDRQLFAQGVR